MVWRKAQIYEYLVWRIAQIYEYLVWRKAQIYEYLVWRKAQIYDYLVWRKTPIYKYLIFKKMLLPEGANLLNIHVEFTPGPSRQDGSGVKSAGVHESPSSGPS